ncbi:RNA polymerase sigma factor [Rhodohalobacter sp. 8-1]|uniref:RNA polymerase sigma factor n=1 Tax=Rhodohalobacter sp. 8-1 TaxID=3131972 RepID=UPI0030EBCC79
MNQRRYEDIIRMHKDTIYRVCLGYIYEADLVEDLFQEVLIALWKSLSTFRGEARLSTFIYRVTVNTAISFNRKLKKHHWENRLEHSPVVYDSPADEITNKEELELLRSCIRRLEDQDRLIITLHLEELSYKEIADIAGISVNYVGVKINRIKATLKQCIQDNE